MFGELTLKISECPSSKYKKQNVLNSDLNLPEFDLFRALRVGDHKSRMFSTVNIIREIRKKTKKNEVENCTY